MDMDMDASAHNQWLAFSLAHQPCISLFDNSDFSFTPHHHHHHHHHHSGGVEMKEEEEERGAVVELMAMAGLVGSKLEDFLGGSRGWVAEAANGDGGMYHDGGGCELKSIAAGLSRSAAAEKAAPPLRSRGAPPRATSANGPSSSARFGNGEGEGAEREKEKKQREKTEPT